jgi:hypothetical protein
MVSEIERRVGYKFIHPSGESKILRYILNNPRKYISMMIFLGGLVGSNVAEYEQTKIFLDIGKTQRVIEITEDMPMVLRFLTTPGRDLAYFLND